MIPNLIIIRINFSEYLSNHSLSPWKKNYLCDINYFCLILNIFQLLKINFIYNPYRVSIRLNWIKINMGEGLCQTKKY